MRSRCWWRRRVTRCRCWWRVTRRRSRLRCRRVTWRRWRVRLHWGARPRGRSRRRSRVPRLARRRRTRIRSRHRSVRSTLLEAGIVAAGYGHMHLSRSAGWVIRHPCASYASTRHWRGSRRGARRCMQECLTRFPSGWQRSQHSTVIRNGPVAAEMRLGRRESRGLRSAIDANQVSRIVGSACSNHVGWMRTRWRMVAWRTRDDNHT
jgi:hypothetical protein